MSEIAGRLAPQAGAHYLEKPKGGRGILLGGVAGVSPGRVVVIGGGMVGYNAAVIAIGLGAQVTILERSVDRMRYLEQILSGRVTLLMSSSLQIEESIREADLVIGAVLIPGALAPKLITREMLGAMKEASVLVDVAIDQGGCAETSRPTTHDDPVYTVDGVIHYCVANMPGAVPITSTRALTNVTLPYVEALADHGIGAAIAARSRARGRRQRLRWADHVRGGRRGAWARVHAARRRAGRNRRLTDSQPSLKGDRPGSGIRSGAMEPERSLEQRVAAVESLLRTILARLEEIERAPSATRPEARPTHASPRRLRLPRRRSRPRRPSPRSP